VFTQVVVDVELADAHAAFDLALAHPLQQDFVAQIGAEAGRRHAHGRQALMQLRHGQPVLPRHRGFGLVDGGLLHPDADFPRPLDLGALHDQPLQHLARQFVGRRQGAARGRLDACHAVAHVGTGDGLGVDQDHDAVGIAHGGRGGGLRPGRGCGHGRQADGAQNRQRHAAAQQSGKGVNVSHSARNGSAG
jgi:hypothetical protein